MDSGVARPDCFSSSFASATLRSAKLRHVCSGVPQNGLEPVLLPQGGDLRFKFVFAVSLSLNPIFIGPFRHGGQPWYTAFGLGFAAQLQAYLSIAE